MKDHDIENIVDYANRLFPENRGRKDKVDRYKWTTVGDKTAWASNDMIEVDRLMIDHSYQRGKLSGRTVDDITRAFDYRLFLPVVVSEMSLCIIDGAHRVAAATRRGIKEVPYSFVRLENKQAEAWYFLLYNKKVNSVKAYDKFRASIAANEGTAVEVLNMATRNGVRLVSDSGTVGHGDCRFVNQLLLSAKNMAACESALIATRRLAVDEPLSCAVFKGVFWLISHGFDIEPHIEKLLRYGGYTAIISRFKKYCLMSGKNYTELQVATAVLDIINIGRRKKITVSGLQRA